MAQDYVVTDTKTGEESFVRAHKAPSATNYVVKSRFTVRPATFDDGRRMQEQDKKLEYASDDLKPCPAGEFVEKATSDG